jgi:hypothetical protein
VAICARAPESGLSVLVGENRNTRKKITLVLTRTHFPYSDAGALLSGRMPWSRGPPCGYRVSVWMAGCRVISNMTNRVGNTVDMWVCCLSATLTVPK